MSNTEPCLLTTKDYTILEVMLDRCLGRDDALAPLLRRKISDAVVMFRDDIPADVVTLNSRVTFRVDDNPSETRILTHDEMRGLVGLALPLANRRGLAMLGLAEGQSASVERPDGRIETLTVLQVAYQPEASRREQAQLLPRDDRRPVLRVVHSSDEPRQQAEGRVLAMATDFDDPGPSAA